MSCFFLPVLILRQTGSFSVPDPFLTFYYVEKRNGILHKNRGEAFEKSYIPLHGGRGRVKNCQNHPYLIIEWLLMYYSRTFVDGAETPVSVSHLDNYS